MSVHEARVLVVEDDKKIAAFVSEALGNEGLTTDVATDVESAFRFLEEHSYSLIVLDLMLPDGSGTEVLLRAKTLKVKPLILVVSAKSSVEERVSGLDLGADDYLVKPFSVVELLARVRALLRRTAPAELDTGQLEFDHLNLTVSHGSTVVKFTHREFQLFHYLVARQNQVMTRSMIAKDVWGYSFDTGTNVVDVYINYLRTKLKPIGSQVEIKTIRGIGYVLRLLDSEAQ